MAETAFTSEHEAELAEIKALSSDLNERLKEGLATLQEIRESQEKALRAGVRAAARLRPHPEDGRWDGDLDVRRGLLEAGGEGRR